LYGKSFNLKDFPQAIKKACEYSENPEQLQDFIAKYNFQADFVGLAEAFDNKSSVMQFIINISTIDNKKKINFRYHCSINDTSIFQGEYKPYYKKNFEYNASQQEKDIDSFFNGFLYSILTCISFEYDCPALFSNFCMEYGYEKDSRKAFDLWQKCLEQSEKLHKVFGHQDLQSFLPQ